MNRNDAMLVAAVLTIAIALGGAEIEGRFGGANAAAWVQAIGTIGAVWAAIWVSSQSQRREDDRAQAKALVLAFDIEPTVISINNAAIFAAKWAEENDFGFNVASTMDMSLIHGKLAILQELPQGFVRDASVLPIDVAKTCIHLVHYLRQYQWMLDSNVSRLRQMDGGQRALFRKAMQISMPAVVKLSTDARNQLRLIRESAGMAT